MIVGVDESSYRRGQRYLTEVCDHTTGAIVWAKPGRNAATLQAFCDELGDRDASIRAVSIDMNGGYEKAIRHGLPDAQVCFDPFHVVQLAGRAVDDVRRAEWNQQGKSRSGHSAAAASPSPHPCDDFHENDRSTSLNACSTSSSPASGSNNSSPSRRRTASALANDAS